jgi:hypothetical protein
MCPAESMMKEVYEKSICRMKVRKVCGASVLNGLIALTG